MRAEQISLLFVKFFFCQKPALKKAYQFIQLIRRRANFSYNGLGRATFFDFLFDIVPRLLKNIGGGLLEI
jgi:hypothetical protein